MLFNYIEYIFTDIGDIAAIRWFEKQLSFATQHTQTILQNKQIQFYTFICTRETPFSFPKVIQLTQADTNTHTPHLTLALSAIGLYKTWTLGGGAYISSGI